MLFFQKKLNLDKKSNFSMNEKIKVSKFWRLIKILIAFVSGIIFATAFPPLNFHVVAFFAMAGVFYLSFEEYSKLFVAIYGYLFGYGFLLFSFWWLREINYVIPFLVAGILGLLFMLNMLLVNFCFKTLVYSSKANLMTYESKKLYVIPFLRELLFVFGVSLFMPCIEFMRITLFPWNFIGVSQWKNKILIQIVEYTGISGVTYLIVLVNIAIAFSVFQILRNLRNNRIYKCRVLLLVLVLLFGVGCFGFMRFSKKSNEKVENNTFRIGVVQGDISQRRISNESMAQEALDVYISLSNKLLAENKNVDVVVWPETAIPYPYGAGNRISLQYRQRLFNLIAKYDTPFLIGSLDYFIKTNGDYDFLNSALFIGQDGLKSQSYSKIYRVPFGEFIPFRKLLPNSILKVINMGRDLRPGTNFEPLELAPNLRAGMAICYESIFAKLARRERQLGANMLLAINNDAWYPTSSEPEQHLANATCRAIENGLTALRVGNNGGCVVIDKRGVIVDSLMDNPIARGRSYGVFEINIPNDSEEMTFYTKYGDAFLSVMFYLSFIIIVFSIYSELKLKKILIQAD